MSFADSGTSTNPCSDTYGGPSAGSAIETQNVQNKLNELASFDNLYGVISYHAYARMWLTAYGYTTVSGGSSCAFPSEYSKVVSCHQAFLICFVVRYEAKENFRPRKYPAHKVVTYHQAFLIAL